MHKFRYLFVISLCIALSAVLHAQENDVTIGFRGGYNASFGGFASASVETHQTLHEHFMISGGLQYKTIGTTAVEARPAYIKDFQWGRIGAECLLSYTNLLSVNSMAIGAGAVYTGKWIGAKLGYFYRSFGSKGDSITEPFNIYYEICANFLPMREDWDLEFIITNNEMFELERHYQPTFIAQCKYLLKEHIGVSMGIGCEPAGMFHMSADYYESYLKLGVCYRW